MPFAVIVVAGVFSALATPSAWRVRPRPTAGDEGESRSAGSTRPGHGPVLIVGAVGAGIGAVVTRHGWTAASPAVLVATLAGLWLAIVDLRVHRLPAAQVYAATTATAALFAVSALACDNLSQIAGAAAGAAALWTLYRVVALTGGMARGDVRLAGLLGAVGGWHGPLSWYIAAALPFLLHAVAGGILWASGARRRGQALPFGPAMLAGMLASIGFAS
ncbi:prepilin peptidase [Parafrankia discariae]|uniref:prepilin peptidase n=1 Tax=Parafrankia discariae TaxID=365528 RepID=UPI00036079BB|nr:prepilin peptidase [Parafrankia discariae]